MPVFSKIAPLLKILLNCKKEKVKQTTLTTKDSDVLGNMDINYQLAKLITSAAHYVAPGHHFFFT